jgi:fumarate hydratase, class II
MPKKLYGPQTEMALKNFPISGRMMPEEFIRCLALIKKHAALVNGSLKQIPSGHAKAIARAASQIAKGAYLDQFPVDVFQTGSGTSSNMNINEVIARLASTKSRKVHPNDHVNCGQSSNDVVPSAVLIACALSIRNDLLPALQHLQDQLRKKAREFREIIKPGRTHLMDAVPVRLGDEFASYAVLLDRVHMVLLMEVAGFFEIPLGGTAVGTGLNAHPSFAKKVIVRLSAETGLQLKEAGYTVSFFEGKTAHRLAMQSCPLKCLQLSAHGAELAVVLMKIAQDIRLMGSGPASGLNELILPELQPGSSIMPDKVNPVLCESVLQVASWVIGDDTTVKHAIAQNSAFELCTAYPLLAEKLLSSVRMLTNVSRAFADKCVKGIRVNRGSIQERLERSAMLITALVPEIGYEKAAAIAREAIERGEAILAVAERRTSIPKKKLVRLLDPRRMV